MRKIKSFKGKRGHRQKKEAGKEKGIEKWIRKDKGAKNGANN